MESGLCAVSLNNTQHTQFEKAQLSAAATEPAGQLTRNVV